MTGKCTNVKEENEQKCEQIGDAQELKSIDDFNAAQAAGGSEAPS